MAICPHSEFGVICIFVGTGPASTHVIDTGDGLIMLDSGYQHSLYLVLQNMHTPGTMSYLFNVCRNNETLTAGLHGGTGVNSMEPKFLDQYGLSYDCRTDFLKAMDRLKNYHVAIFLGNHVGQNNTRGRYQKILEGDSNAFVDPEAWAAFAEFAKQRVVRIIEADNMQL